MSTCLESPPSGFTGLKYRNSILQIPKVFTIATKSRKQARPPGEIRTRLTVLQRKQKCPCGSRYFGENSRELPSHSKNETLQRSRFFVSGFCFCHAAVNSANFQRDKRAGHV